MVYIHIVTLAIGLFFLVKGADLIAKYAHKFADATGITDLAIGMTLVSITTSLPELAITLASLSTNPKIAAGTVIGSNISNISLILGLAVILKSIRTEKEYLKNNYFLILLTFIVVIMSFDGFNYIDGIILIILSVFYFKFFMKFREEGILNLRDRIISFIYRRETIKNLLIVVIGGAALALGSGVTITSSQLIATEFNIAEFYVALFIISVGTSLPELAASIVAAYRGLGGIAIGNIIGSCIFNISFILGVTGIFQTIIVPLSELNVAIFLLLPIILVIFLRTGHNLSRKEGTVLFLIYLLFIVLNLFSLTNGII